MDTDELAQHLFTCAAADEQVAHRVQPADDVARIREAVRRLARDRDVRIRTALVDDVLVVVRADARVWNDSAATMRAKLSPGDEA